MIGKLAYMIMAIAILVAGACVDVRAADDPILIASVFAHTGKAAEENSPNYLMVRLAVKTANAHGGALGRRIQLLELDNKSTAIGSYEAAMDAVKAGVVAVVGPSWSSHGFAMAPVLQKARVPMIGATTSAPELTRIGDFIFRACYTNETQAQALARFAAGTLKATTAAALTVAGDVYSEDLAKQFQMVFEKLGGSVVLKKDYLLSSMDFHTQLTAIRHADPDVVLVPGFARDSGLILKQARNMGMNMPFLGGDGWTALEKYPHIEELRGENYYVSHWHPGSKTPASQRFLEAVREELGETVLNDIDAGHPVAYDATMLVVDSIRRAGSAEPAAIRDALADTTDFKGVTGAISFIDSRDPVKPLVVLRISGDTTEYVQTVVPE